MRRGNRPLELAVFTMAALIMLPCNVAADDELDALIAPARDAAPAADDAPVDEQQDAAEDEAPRGEPRQAAYRPQIEEIVVTAQKREQALSDVPISVTAISGKKLVDAGIENLTDLSEYTPNFKLVDSALIPNIYMRGVGSGSNQGFEMSVGIFADGIHLGRPHQTRAAFLDLERAEVLRGPQSILFGKNAIAGALNLVSARPGDEYEASLGIVQGRSFDGDEYNAVLSGPLSDDFGARFAFRRKTDEGYLYNNSQQRMEPGLKEDAGRLTLDWSVSDTVESSLKLEKTRREQRGRTFQTTHPGAITRCTGENVRLDDIRETDARESASIDAYNHVLTLEAQVGGGQLTSVTGYSGFESEDLFDADSSTVDTLALLGVENYEQISQELRFAVDFEQFNYIVGAFYQKGELEFFEFGPTKARAGALADSPVCAINQQVLAEADLERDFFIDSEAWSVFAQGSWYATDRLQLTAGLRYVKEEKQGFREFRIFEPGTQTPANLVTMQALDQLLINEHRLRREREVDVYLPSLNLQYAVTDNGMAYAAFTRGAKSGSFDARNNNGNTDAQGGATRFEFDDEIADSYEVGSKLKLLEGSADLNIALFNVDYEDMQVSVYDGASGFTVTNAGEAQVRGLELDGRWLATESWLLRASVAWLDFKWTDYSDGPCYHEAPGEDPDSGTCDLTGRENLQTPKYTASLGGEYKQPLGDNLGVSFALDVNYRDAHFVSGDLDPRGKQPSHYKYNARLALASLDGRWSIALLGKNLGDEIVRAVGAPTSLDLGGYRVATEGLRSVFLEARANF